MVQKILSIKENLTSIKGHNSVRNRQKITSIRTWILYISMQVPNSSICSEDMVENTFLHQSRAITLLFMNKFSPFSNPNRSSPISTSMQSLKKIGQKLLKSGSRNEARIDGWMDGWMDKQFGGYNVIPATFLWQGIKICIMPITSTTTNCHQIIQLLCLTSEPCHEKTCFCHMQTTMGQISLCICPFVVRCLDSIIPLVSISKISSLYLASVAAQAGSSLTWSQTQKTDFLVTRLISSVSTQITTIMILSFRTDRQIWKTV